MSSGSCKVPSAASSITAAPPSTPYLTPRYYRHSSYVRSSNAPSSFVPTGANRLNESYSKAPQPYSSGLSKSAVASTRQGTSQGTANLRVKVSSLPASSHSPATMDSSSGSSAGNRSETSDKGAIASLPSKPLVVSAAGDRATRGDVNGEVAVTSLATNLETSLSLAASNSTTAAPITNVHSSSTAISTYNGCQSCAEPSMLENANNNNNNSSISDGSLHSVSHGNSCSDSSKSLNMPKFGTPVPNRVFVGGIPLDATEYDVRQLFAQYGNISSVKIISDRAGISRGYGFVTYDSEEDAQKVIKEAENLIIKHRRLNVSTAVMKHQGPFGFDPRMIPNGSFIYPQLPFNSPANFSQYYPENFHSLCAAEGLPIYQLAGVNGHSFMTNCPSYLSPPSANYLNPTAAAAAAGAYGAAYQNPTSYIYPGMGPPGSATAASLQMQPSQHSLFQSQHAAASQALLSANSLSNAFQYPSGACGQQGTSTANAAALQAMRYGTMPSNHSHSSSGASSQSINMNSPSNQAYMSYSNSAPSALNHPSMHLSSGMSMHPHQSHLASLQLNSEMAANANSVAQSGLSSGANAQMNAALLHHAHHSHSHQASSAMYANYQANMAAAAAHSLAANSGQMACMPGMHLKSDGTGMEMLDNVSASMMNGMNGGTAVSSSALASLPATVHISSNGYMPQMMEVIWPSSHLPNAPAYCTGSAPLHLNSNTSAGGAYSTLGNCNSKTQSNMHGSNARSITSLPTVSCSTSSNNAYSKSSHNANLPNGHSSTSSSNVSAANGNATAATPNSGSTSSNQSNNSSKEKGPQAAMARHSASSSSSSYGPSHKKMYNGNGNINSHSTYSNNANKSKPMNGNLGNGSTRYPLNSTDSTVPESPLCSEPPAPYSAPKQQPPQQQQQQYSKQPSTPIPHTPSLATISPPKVNGSVIGSPPAFVTKTVNGVQIYALAGNGDAGGMLDGTGPVTKSPPVGAMAGTSVAYKAC